MKKKRIAVIIIVIAVVVAAFFIIRKFFRTGEGGQTSQAVVQSVNSINSADLTSVNRYSAMVDTQKSEDIKLDQTMTLKECYVELDQHVKKGDKLFSYDTQSIEIDIQQKQLNIERLKINIENNEASIALLNDQMNKAADADKMELSSQILELQSGTAQAEYDIKVAEAEIKKLQSGMENSTVTAPIDGTVTAVNDPNMIQDGDGAYITITADGEFRVKGRISEQNIMQIYEKQRVILRSRVDDSKIWKGEISLIETKPETDNQDYYGYSDTSASGSNYSFYVELDSIDGLMLGQHLTVEADYGQEELGDGIWISSGWLVFENEKTYCWAASSTQGKLEKREVQTGEFKEESDLYRIDSGISRSDYLAWPQEDYYAGMPVSVRSNEGADGMDIGEPADSGIDVVTAE